MFYKRHKINGTYFAIHTPSVEANTTTVMRLFGFAAFFFCGLGLMFSLTPQYLDLENPILWIGRIILLIVAIFGLIVASDKQDRVGEWLDAQVSAESLDVWQNLFISLQQFPGVSVPSLPSPKIEETTNRQLAYWCEEFTNREELRLSQVKAKALNEVMARTA